MKKLVALLLVVTSVSLLGRAWQSSRDIGFEIRNHDRFPIRVSLQQLTLENPNDPNSVAPVAHIIKDAVVGGKQGTVIPSLQKALNINENIVGIVVNFTDPATLQQYERLYLVQPGKTIYVAWENRQLRPQKGRGVFQRETQSGWSLANNVTQNDLRPFVPQEPAPDINQNVE
ncbi:hypothetical protein Noda2021_08990 [Candidatus Dependentiae bacterium Noda2021]|nr:hypothetical protein Noda2021_08990 [Candidatus Dependentiae bacterium Noda2021]